MALPRLPARAGARAAHALRHDRLPVLTTSPTGRTTGTGVGRQGKDDWSSEELLAMVRELQPGCRNDRLDIPGDFITPEQYQPSSALPWSGRPARPSTAAGLRPRQRRLQIRADAGADARRRVSKGGNMCSTSGPTGRGSLDPHAVETLAGIGEWMALHARSCTAPGRPRSPRRRTPATPCAATGSTCTCWPGRSGTCTCRMADKIEYAQLSRRVGDHHDSRGRRPARPQHTPGSQPPGTLTLTLPVRPPR